MQMQSSTHDFPQTIDIAGYEIIRPLGHGASANVYLAKQESTAQEVAIKVLRVEFGTSEQQRKRLYERFDREAQVCAALKHPHIVRLIDKGQTANHLLFAVFEYVPGITLKEYLLQNGALAAPMTGQIMSQVIDALSAAHQIGIAHRDLKPSNIMLNTQGATIHAMILDFGISAFVNDNSDKQLTMTHESLGTPSYSAPEQLRGEPPTNKSDLYAWGLVTLECLTGKPAVTGNSVAEIFHKQLSPLCIPIPATLAAHPLATLLNTVLNKNVVERASDAKQVYTELQSINLTSLVGTIATPETTQHPDGADYTQTLTGTLTQTSTWAQIKSERRQITALSFILSISNTTDASLDTDIIDELQTDQLNLCVNTCVQHGGYLCSTLGNIAMVYFGYPEVTDNDARRAARTALQLLTEVKQRSALMKSQQLSLDIRIGIHTGIMVSSGKSLPSGHTANTALKLLTHSNDGPVLVSGDAKKLLDPYLVFEPVEHCIELTNQHGKPLDVEKLVSERRVEAMSFLRPSSINRNMVGRSQELEKLETAWTMLPNKAELLRIEGEAGIGKSRLLFAFRKERQQDSQPILYCQCLNEHKNNALYPFLELVRTQLGIHNERSQQAIERLKATLRQLSTPLTLSLPLLCSWLGLPLPEGIKLSPLPPEQQKDAILRIIEQLLAHINQHQKSLLIIEDYHWIDPTSIELIARLKTTSSPYPLFVLATSRPETPVGSQQLTFDHEVKLKRLSTETTLQLVKEILGDNHVTETTGQLIHQRTDGIPLYVEELTQMLLDSGLLEKQQGSFQLSMQSDDIPITLRDSLYHKLDRLGLAKETAQLAATIGREFDYPILISASAKHEADIQADLKLMQDADIIYPRRQVHKTSYIFKHALLKDAAYDSVLKSSRPKIHQQIAETLESHAHQDSPSYILGFHWDKAQYPTKAGKWYLRAGQEAAGNFANRESISHFSAAIQALEKTELDDSTRLVTATAHEGIGERQMAIGDHDAARIAFKTALKTLNAQFSLPSIKITRKLGKSWETHHIHSKALDSYLSAAKQLDAFPSDQRNHEWWSEWLEIRSAQLYVHYWQGNTKDMTTLIELMEPVVEREATSLQQARFLDDLLHLRLRQQRFKLDEKGVDIARNALKSAKRTTELPVISWAQFMLGFALYFNHQYHESHQAMLAAQELAIELQDITLQSRCLTYLTIIHRHLGDVALTQSYAQQALDVSCTAGMDDYVAAAYANLGWAHWKLKEPKQAQSALSESRRIWDDLATSYPYPFQWLGLLTQLQIDFESAHSSKRSEHFTPNSAQTAAIKLLLDEKQQQLPDNIIRPLSQLLTMLMETTPAKAPLSLLSSAIESAKQTGHL